MLRQTLSQLWSGVEVFGTRVCIWIREATSELKGGICHSDEWQMPPFSSEGGEVSRLLAEGAGHFWDCSRHGGVRGHGVGAAHEIWVHVHHHATPGRVTHAPVVVHLVQPGGRGPTHTGVQVAGVVGVVGVHHVQVGFGGAPLRRRLVKRVHLKTEKNTGKTWSLNKMIYTFNMFNGRSRLYSFFFASTYELLSMLKIRRDINQQYWKIVDLHFVKFE